MMEGLPVPLMLPRGTTPATEQIPQAPRPPRTDGAGTAAELRANPLGETDAIGGLNSLEQTDALAAAGEQFLQLLVEANERKHSAKNKMQDLAEGRSDDIHGTMIEMTKAGIETRLVVNAKNKIVDAFYELWRMNI